LAPNTQNYHTDSQKVICYVAASNVLKGIVHSKVKICCYFAFRLLFLLPQ